jgi:hypothetical protein
MQKDRDAFFCEGVSPKIVRGTGRIFGAGKRGWKLMQKSAKFRGSFRQTVSQFWNSARVVGARVRAAVRAREIGYCGIASGVVDRGFAIPYSPAINTEWRQDVCAFGKYAGQFDAQEA